MGYIKDIDESQAPLLDHLIELRARLLRAVGALAVAFFACLYFAKDIFGFLVRPLTAAFPPGQGRLVYTKLYEQFFVELKVALFAAFFLSFPVIANQLWAFVAPGLYAKEKRAFLPFIIATPVLFALGASLAYFVVMPTAFHWMLGFQGSAGGLTVEALPGGGRLSQPGDAVHPGLRDQLSAAGIVAAAQPCRDRQARTVGCARARYMIVVAFAVAAIATPPDVVSQLMPRGAAHLPFRRVAAGNAVPRKARCERTGYRTASGRGQCAKAFLIACAASRCERQT